MNVTCIHVSIEKLKIDFYNFRRKYNHCVSVECLLYSLRDAVLRQEMRPAETIKYKSCTKICDIFAYNIFFL